MDYQGDMKTSTANLGRARREVGARAPLVVGAALKLAMSGTCIDAGDHARIDAGLTEYHWKSHRGRVAQLAKILRALMAPGT